MLALFPRALPSTPLVSPASRRRISNVVRHRTPFRLAVVGSGPAGFYSAYRVMARVDDALVDMYEQLPVPFGLVRYGVAPDHPEVKNCQDKFTEVATSPRFNFIGNLEVGKHLPLTALKDNYDAVLFAYGASKDRRLAIPGEELRGVYSARAFVGWYNGLPEYADLAPDLTSGDTAVIVGQGNVALDVARILLGGVDRLRTTDITANALETLSRSHITRVHVVGRRGPMQASFTIKEVRELMHLPEVAFHPIASSLLPPPDTKLPRAQKRIAQLLQNASNEASADPSPTAKPRSLSLHFMRTPSVFHPDQTGDRLSRVGFTHNTYQEDADIFGPSAKVRPTADGSAIDTTLAFRSIGYQSEPLPGMDRLGFSFDTRAGVVPNDRGRVLSPQGTPVPGMYCTGWVKSGPTGVIATTMQDAFAAAETIVQDCKGAGQGRRGWDALGAMTDRRTVSWRDWSKIDGAEREMGSRVGKEREKFRSVTEMLSVLD